MNRARRVGARGLQENRAGVGPVPHRAGSVQFHGVRSCGTGMGGVLGRTFVGSIKRDAVDHDTAIDRMVGRVGCMAVSTRR